MPIEPSLRGVLRSSENILLRGLGDDVLCLLEPHAEIIMLRHGQVLFYPNERLDAFYFPDTVFLSLEQSIGKSPNVEVAVVGREGMVGWPSLLSCDFSTNAAVVRSDGGRAFRICAHSLRLICQKSPALLSLLLKFVHFMTVQMAQSITSHIHDSLDHRLARWLLMRHDRLRGDILLVHHDAIADGLSVRRASVTDRLHVLEGERLIRCTRGKIVIRDRVGLEAFAGDTYGFSEAHYRAQIAPFGKTITNVLRP